MTEAYDTPAYDDGNNIIAYTDKRLVGKLFFGNIYAAKEDYGG